MLEELISSILNEARRKPRPPGYEEALRDSTRTAQSIADEFGFSQITVLNDRRDLGIVTGRELGPGGSARPRPPGYEEALRDTTRTNQSIANEFGLSVPTLIKDRGLLGIAGPGKGGMNKSRPRSQGYEEALRDTTRTDKSIGDEFGFSQPVVNRNRRELGIVTPRSLVSVGPGPRRPRPPGYEEALRDTERSAQSIADEFGFNAMTVFRDRNSLGISRSVRGIKRDRPPGYEEALRDTERSAQSIADEFELSFSTVFKDRKDQGIVTGRELTRNFGPPGYEEALRDTERSADSIADEFGVSKLRVLRDRSRSSIESKDAHATLEKIDQVSRSEQLPLPSLDPVVTSLKDQLADLEEPQDAPAPPQESFADRLERLEREWKDRIARIENLENELRDRLSKLGRPSQGGYRRPRPPGYEEALRDTTRSLQSIADEFGFSEATVHRERKELGVETGRELGPGGSHRARSPSYEEAIRDTTRSVQSIADEFGVSKAVPFRDRRRLGIVTGREFGPGGSARPRPAGYEEALRDTTMTSQSISDDFGVPESTVRKDRKVRGIVKSREFGSGRSARLQSPDYREESEQGSLTYDDVLWDLTRSDQQVADMFGVSPQRVRNDRSKLEIV
jgi:hypothetical protein